MRLYPSWGWYSTEKSLPLIDLCVAAALDAVKAGVTLPWGATETPTEGTPTSTSSDADVLTGAHIPVVENEVDAQPTAADPAFESATESPSLSASSPDDTTEALPEHPLRVISLSNFEKALKEITPSSSESLGTLSELRK